MPKNGTATETRGNRAYVEITSISKRQNSMPLKRDARVSESSVRRTLSGRQVYVEIVTPFKSQDARSERSASPTLSRRNLAYVEIASPFKRAPPSQDPGSSVVPVHKRTATRKRGLSDSGAAENQQGGEARKRTKAVENGDHLHSVDDARVGMSPQPNRNDDFPEGSFFCHQCNAKKSPEHGIHCTYLRKENRCAKKYCSRCLKNRYGLSMSLIQSDDTSSAERHISTAGYVFKCPSCDGNCNCSPCRKKKGLPPTGKFNVEDYEKLAELDAAREVPSGQPSRRVQKATEPKPEKAPLVRWTPLPVPASFTHARAEERIHVREFFIRFPDILLADKTIIEELEVIDGDMIGSGATDPRDGGVDEVTVSWVSPECAREVMASLCDVLATNEDDIPQRQVYMDTSMSLRASGANLNRMWSALQEMPKTIDTESKPFPDPLPPPPTAATARMARKGRATDISVVHTAQLLPVIAALIDVVCMTEQLHTALGNTRLYAEELIKEGNVAAKQVKDQEKADKQSGVNKTKEARTAHKELLLDIQRATELRTSGICPRVGPLGTDKDGRVYWVLSPGMAERESAEDLLRAVVDKGANRRPMRGQNASPLAFRRLAAPTEAERTRLTRWSWFVAVWGTRPDDASMIRTEDDEDEDEDENADERWWCFWKPEDIEALADWLAFTHRTDDEARRDAHDSQTEARSKSPHTKLVDDVRQFGKLLAWRVKRADALANTLVGTSKGRRSGLAPVAFY